MIQFLFYSAAVFAAALAAAVSLRDRRATARRTLAFALLLLGVQSVLAGKTHSALGADAALWRAWWLIPHALSPAVWLLFVLKYCRGNSNVSVRKWLPALVLFTLLPLAAITLVPDSVLLSTPEQQPGRDFQIGLGGFVLYLCNVICSALILIHLERTFRAAVGTMRWRIKYVILATGVIFVANLYTASQVLLFKGYSASFDIIHSTALIIASALYLNALLRTGLFRVQVYPSEQVLQFSLAGVLIGSYLLIIGVFSKLFAGWQGPDAFAFKAFLLLSSLALIGIILVSERSRDRLKRWVSRHFHRPFYDYRAMWLSLTGKTATILDPDELSQSVAVWISENLRVLSASVWLVEPDSQSIRLAASTGLATDDSTSRHFSGEQASAIIRALQAESSPFDLDKRQESWTGLLKQCYPDMFEGAGNRVCVPLSSAGRLVGFCTLGDRVNYIALELQEFELLRCVGDQVASNLLNLQLSRDLLQSKEMEAFQTISAFFVHDLKNTASSLNLTLQNLPKHFDNPEFRKDALRAIGSSVKHIQDLVTRLSLFKQKLELHRSPTDLNECVQNVLNTLKLSNSPIATELQPLDLVSADPDQIQKVITNLILNAIEALGPNGKVQIATSQQNGHITLSVHDNGAGMSPDFLAKSLFRPFKTTKKGGIGIGMFQTKAIIDAHGGRVDVQSQLGHGTTFQVFIPIVTP